MHIKHRTRLEGASEEVVTEKTKWHRSRAKAQRLRILRVLECGAEELAITCPCCGVVSEMSLGCGARLYCFHCRDAYASRRRGQFLTAWDSVLSEARAAGLLEVSRRGRRYGEKFLTLTVLHLGSDTIQARIFRLVDAGKHFLKKLCPRMIGLQFFFTQQAQPCIRRYRFSDV